MLSALQPANRCSLTVTIAQKLMAFMICSVGECALDATGREVINMQTINLILPRYQHDCDVCRFIGHVGHVDCYTCGDSVVMRYGNDRPDYSSMPRAMSSQIPEYATVLEMEQRIVASGGFQI